MTRTAAREGATFDYVEAVGRLDGQPELFGMVASIFVEDCPSELRALRSALDSGDAEAVAFTAHKLKGALSSIGANPARAAARRLEELGRTGDLTAAREAYPELESSLDALLPELEPYLDTVV